MIILNNTKEDIRTENLTVSGLLKIKNFTFRMLVVTHQRKSCQKG